MAERNKKPMSKVEVGKLPAVSRKTSKFTRELKSRRNAYTPPEQETGKVKIIPLGGLGLIGMNITVIEYADSIVVVDCGMAFPEDDMPGIDCVVPDVTYLIENKEKVKGFVITHGHEDHIGALPYILKEVNVPVYATRLTIAIIESKLAEHEMLKTTRRRVVRYGQTVTLGDIKVEFIRTNHSIVDAAALAIHTPAGTIVHTGDFKVDYTPVFGDPIDLQRFGEIGRKGVLALLCDSTNILRPGFTSSERTVGRTFDQIFQENIHHRIIVATFASNVDRVQQIITCAEKYHRKVIIEGRSMVNIITIAKELGYLTIQDGTLIGIEDMNKYTDEQLVLITTGSQGEEMAALSRIAAAVHRKVSIHPGDAIVFSSSPIPGNEKSITKVINELYELGANVVLQDTHVSGHACQEEVKLIYALTKPRYAVPVHGEYRHLLRHKQLAEEMGIPKDRAFLLSSGDVVELSFAEGKVAGHVPAFGRMVDGLGVGDIGNAVLHDRQKLSENGLVTVVLAMYTGTNEVVSGPEMISRGFVYVKESEELLGEAVHVVETTLARIKSRGTIDRGKIRGEIRDDLADYIWKQTHRTPMILPVIMDVD